MNIFSRDLFIIDFIGVLVTCVYLSKILKFKIKNGTYVFNNETETCLFYFNRNISKH